GLSKAAPYPGRRLTKDHTYLCSEKGPSLRSAALGPIDRRRIRNVPHNSKCFLAAPCRNKRNRDLFARRSHTIPEPPHCRQSERRYGLTPHQSRLETVHSRRQKRELLEKQKYRF